MRLVTIDHGNTNSTVAIFDNHLIKEVIALKDFKKLEDDFILISSVGSKLNIQSSFDLKLHRSSTHFFDMPVHYSMTLGEDRLICAYGIFKTIKKNERHLVIDAGTFITCDVITKDGFLGGHIFPGIERFLSTYAISENLEKYTFEDFINHKMSNLLPQSTKEAILEATKVYLKETVSKIVKTASPDKVTLTGGSAIEINKLVNLEVPSELNHHLVHLALEKIHQLHCLAV